MGIAADLEINLDADPTTADVGEWITFNWTDNGGFYKGQINFGDGNITILALIHKNSSVIHKYETEGQYNVTLYATTEGGTSEDTDSILIEIKNNPPQFDISLLNEAFEDEEVNVSVVNLVESDHDLEPGILSFVYDFADGDPITTNTSSIIHEWNNAGVYKVTVTVIDDQGALDQKSQYIQINNKAPDAYFTFAPAFAENNTQSNYYGTYDFRGDIIGEEPEDWEVYDSDDVADRYTAIIRPNGDALTEWLNIPTPHWSRVDESGNPDGDYINTTHHGGTYQKERFNMGTVDLDGGVVTKIVIHAYGKVYDYYYPDQDSQPSSNIYLGGWKGDKVWNFPQGSYGWRTLTWDNLYASQTELDELQIQFKSNLRSWDLIYHTLDTVYCEVFYTYDMHVSVVNETGYYGQVVQLYDDETGEQVSMENNLPVAQTHGSIEFYVRSDDVTEQTWALCIYDDSTIGLKILMENDQWKYYNGTSDTISECGTPSDDQWYWVRLDFCSSGTYLGLNAHQYRLTVDSSESNIYHFKDINQVNKIRFESGEPDLGTAVIDAVGYTWSPYYNHDDNKYAVISYPEKTNVQFVANCSDTESDLGPLRYYWDFGDGCSGWGKYALHNYLESGIYIVNLTCKDDNGKTDWHSEMVFIHNFYPDVMNITCLLGSMTITEGETILFNALPADDESDLSRLSYWWDFEGYNFDPYNTSNFESGGWIKPHLYMDDYYGNMYVLVKDPETAFGYKAVLINVSNVDPLLSIWDASILANISFEVYKGTPNDNANFTFDLLSNDESVLTELIDTTGDLSTNKTEVATTLSKIWKVVVNSSDELPSGSWFRCYVKLNFLSGEELVILSPKLYGDEYGFWEVDLNPYFYDNGDYTFMYPITFDAHIWDPSVDDISFSIQYNVSMHLVIDCDNSLPLEDSFSLGYVDYMINSYTVDGVQYTNITASQQVLIDTYNDNNFPVSLDINFTVYPIIDLYELLEIQMELTNLTILHCDIALNYLIGDVWDDDDGEGTLTITFTTDDNIEFENLSPYPQYYIPDQALEGTNVTFYVEVSDFDQIREQEDYYVANFKDYDVPTMPDDFDLINGTCDWEGDLFFQDNNLVTFNPNGHYPATWGFEDEVDGTSGTNIQFVDTYSADASCHAEIEGDIGSHKKVLELYDNNAAGSIDVSNSFTSAQTSGIVEAWVRLSSTTGHFQFRITDNTYYQANVWFNSVGNIQYYDGSWHTVRTYSANTWYHLKIEFDCTTDTYSGWIDGVLEWEDAIFHTATTTLTKVALNTGNSYKNIAYVDAVGYSWDSNYKIGDNIYWNNYKDVSSDFESEDTNTEGTDINFVDYDLETPNTHIKIVPSFDEHKKVLECYDNSPSRWVIANNFSSNQISGTMEGYVWSTNVGNGYTTYISINKDGYGFSNDGAVIRMNYYKLQRQKSDSSWVDIISSGITANTKYHWRIDFECGSGQYEGLSADTYYLYWDGTKYGPYEFHNGFDNLDSLVLYNGVSAANYYSYYDAIGYSWESDYNIGDNLYGPHLLNCITTFHLDNIKDDEIIKYLKLFYAYKTEFSALVNISIYNFHYENWTLIDSTDVGTDIYKNKYSILSAEYINDTYDILVKIESNTLIGEFYLDQFKFEYYSSEVSEYGSFDHEFIPDLSSDFTLYSGWSDWEGELSSIDDSYTTFRSCEGKEEVWLMMDEGTGTNTLDSIDQNQNGTIYGASWTTGKLGDYALDFDASNYDYVDVDYNLPNVGYTTCAWYKTTSVGGHIIGEGLVGESQSTNLQGIVIYSSTQIGYRLEIGPGSGPYDYKFTPTGNIIDGQWHFVCAVITSGNLVFYWDDQKFTSSILNTDTTANNFWIGCYGGPGSGSWFDGPIDDVRVYESALSDDEIEWLYNNGNGREETCRGLTTGIIRPNGDITTGWNVVIIGALHYSVLQSSGENKLIYTLLDYRIDELEFETIPRVDTVTKIEVKMYAMTYSSSSQPSVDVYLGDWQGWKTCSWGFYLYGYTWTSLVWSGLNASQEDLNGFRFRISAGNLDSLVYLDALYVIVTYIPGSGLSVASDLHLDGVRPIDQLDSVDLQYSFKTDIDLDIDLCLYNYSSKSWDVVNSSSHTQFTNCSYEITDSDYFSPYYDVRVKFERQDSALFEFYLEKLKLYYEWTKGSYNDDYLYSNCPDYPEDFVFYNGTCDSEGNFEVQDNDFYTFNSTANGDLDFYAVLSLEAAQPSDLIKSLWLNYSYKTDISQTIEIKLYNFTANEWYLIDSSVHTSFSNESYIIPISRIEIVNGTEIEYHDFYNANFDIFVQFEGENQVSEFQLFVDQLKVEYTVLSYLFIGDSSRKIDVVEGDYISFDSDDSENIYHGTYSFEDDEAGTTGTDISFVDIDDTGDYCSVSIVESFDNHHKVLKLTDGSYEYICDITNNFVSAQSFGTIEFWEQSEWTTMVGPAIELKDVNNNLLLAYRINNYKHQRYTGTSWSDISNANDDTWYHIRIDFETTTGSYVELSQNTYKIIIDETEYGPYSVVTNDVSPTKLRVYAGSDSDSDSFYLDAFGYSWDPNYIIGDNLIVLNIVDETFDITLDQLNSHRLGLFESCEVSYSINTSLTQKMFINVYNYTGGVWTEYSFLTTDNSKLYNGSFVFTNNDFISEDFNVSIQFYGFNSSGNAFTLHIYKLDAKYDWSIAHADCGIGSYSHSCPLQIYYNMSSRYSTMFYEDFMFDYEGTYLITMSSDDGYHTTKTGMVIEISSLDPFATIGGFINETIEDKNIHFTSEISIPGSNATKTEYKYFWLFGDGSFSNDPDPIHAYAESGVYNVSLTVIDCFGNSYTVLRNITIAEKAPQIVGPYTFYGVEGQAITLDVDIFDAFLDEVDMKYEWFNSTNDLISTDKRPSIILQDGFYEYTLNVTDSLGQIATADISVIVEDTPPVVIAQSYMYSGASVSGEEGFFGGSADDPGELVLTAYGYDTSDNSDLDYHWTVYKGDEIFDGGIDYNSGITSTRKFRVTDTVLYRGEVKIVSAEKSTVTTFLINSFIDDNGNGFSNEFEERLAETGENITAYSDADGDCLSDLYELGISNTSYLDPDTDGDGLYDGFDPDTGIGEWTAGTDPLDWDCDSDSLSDGMEFIGWKISSELLGEVIVSSDPWDNDTDDDCLSDYDEYYAGTDPRNSDTDNDGANDNIDPHPLKWDGDEDGLCDGLELQLGTNPNNTDTDSDGISDGEEVIGWAFKTNPLTSDSDRDFVADTAEYQNYKVAIDDRYNLDDPVNISFEVNCEKAMAAQIAFLITFGEAINENEKVYGIQDVPDLNVIIYKVDDNLLLFNMTTNSTRYFSQVVDIRETMENHSLDYRGEYMIEINNTEAGCILEQFEIDITGYLDPNDEDFDDDGIMDGVEMGLLVKGTDTLNFTDSYWYDNLTVNEKYISEGGGGSGLIASVEHVEITLGSGVTSNYATLSKNQDISNCVPFATVKLNTYGDDWDENMVDLYFESSPDTRLVAERGEGGGSVVVSAYIVEFDDTKIKVQSDSFSTSNSYIEKSITSVDTSKAVPLAYWKITGNDDDWDCAMVATDFEGSDTVRMERDQATGTITGHYYVFEALNSEFSAQKVEMSMSTSEDFDTATINSVDMSKSFIIASYECNVANDDPEEGAIDIWLNSETEVRAERRPEANSYDIPTINVFVISFDSSGSSSVQRDSFTWANEDASKQATISEVDLDAAMVKGGTMYGIMECDGTGSNDPKTSFIQYEFDGSTTVRGERYTYSEDGTSHWEVIEWELQSGTDYSEFEIEPIIEEFYLDIPDLGRVYDANITVKIESEGIPIGIGEVNITLIKEEINCSIDDVVLFDEYEEFDNTSAYSFERFLDLTGYVNNGTISDYYGTYLLKIVIFDTNYTQDNFTLSEFYILTDTYIDAGPTDTHAWYTDPALADSDFDGWNDYIEIFNKETNPLNPDTDFDGIWDSFDRDPKRNVMLEIIPLSASVPNDYKLKIVVKFTVDGDNYYMPTPKLKANVFEDPLYTAYYDLHYYIDISDDKRIPNDYDLMRFDIELWRVDRYGKFLGVKFRKWDKRLVSGDEYYYIETPGHEDILTVEKYDESELKYQAKVKVKTIGIEKANTIAVYEINDTSFTGHYQEAEKMNIIQLYINDTPPSSSPFVEGPNCIVISTSLFTETILNAYIQTERLNETVFYSSDEDKFKFISIERDGSAKQACEEVDFVMVRFDISYEDAEEVLDLILTCVINETLDEFNNTIAVNATLYTYVSTKLNGTSAVMLNLPDAALGYVPWFCENESSELGGKPLTKSDWFWKPIKNLLNLGKLVLGFILSPFLLPIVIWNLIVEYVLEIIKMFILPILAYILWLIIRVILLVFAYILLAIELAMTSIMILAIAVGLLVFDAFSDISYSWGLNLWVPYGKDTKTGWVEFDLFGRELNVTWYVKWVYWDFFDLYFPMPEMDFGMFESIEDMTNMSEDDFNQRINIPPRLHCGFIQVGDYDYQFSTIYTDYENNPPDYTNLYLISPSGIEHDFSMSIPQTGNYSIDWWESQRIEDWIEGWDGGQEYFEYDSQEEDFNPQVWEFGVNFTATVDFEDSGEFDQNDIDGQWYYYYKTKDEINSEVQQWPEDFIGYCCQFGPRINVGDIMPYLSFSNVNSSLTFDFNDVEFKVTGFRDISDPEPNSVNLTLLLPDFTTYTFEMENISSTEYDDAPDYSFFYNKVSTEYSVVLNFSEQFSFEDDTSLYYYFDAEFVDGNHSLLFQSVLDNNNNTISGWFGPVEIWKIAEDGSAMIKRAYIDHFDGNGDFKYKSLSKENKLNPLIIHDEHILRFWVGIKCDKTHMEIYNATGKWITPILKLTTLNNSTCIELDMMYVSGKSDDNLDWYFVDVYHNLYSYTWKELGIGEDGDDNYDVWETDFGSGAWNITFEVKDVRTDNIDTMEMPRRIWHVGSFAEMLGVMWGGPLHSQDGIITMVGIVKNIVFAVLYSVSAIMLRFPQTETAGRFILNALIIVELLMQFVGIATFWLTGNTGALLGLIIYNAMSLAGYAISYILARFTNALEWAKIPLYISMIYGLVALMINLYCNPIAALFTAIAVCSTLAITNVLKGSTKGKLIRSFLNLAIITFAPTLVSVFLPTLDFKMPGEQELRTHMQILIFATSTMALGGVLGILGLIKYPSNPGEYARKSLSKLMLVTGIASGLAAIIFLTQSQWFDLLNDMW